jgi:6-phosphogluconolactonase
MRPSDYRACRQAAGLALAKNAVAPDPCAAMNGQIKVVPNPAAVAQEAAERVIVAAGAAIGERGLFSMALAGGHTPEALYQLLAHDSYRSRIDWTKVELFFGDERCVPPDSPESNYNMARRTLISQVPIPGDNVYRMRGEVDPNEAAKEYGQRLKEKFGDEGGIDLVLLGMGDDGHTASLFPGTEALRESKHRCVANFVPKLDAWRITLTAPFLNRSGQVLALVAGAGKAQRVREVLEGPDEPERLPIQIIRPTHGQMVWIIDAAAAGMNDEP